PRSAPPFDAAAAPRRVRVRRVVGAVRDPPPTTCLSRASSPLVPPLSAHASAGTRSGRSGCAGRRLPSAERHRESLGRFAGGTAYGRPRQLLIDSAGVDDRLGGLVPAQHDEEVTHHGGFPLVVEGDD